jgi:hypothetical protein
MVGLHDLRKQIGDLSGTSQRVVHAFLRSECATHTKTLAMTRLGRRACRLLLAATFVALTADAGAQEGMMCGQAFDGDVAALAERIRQLPHADAPPQKNILGLHGIYVRPPRFMATDGAIGTIWYFTPPEHPAHPSVSCLRIVNKGDRRFDSQFHCQAAKEHCDKLAVEIREHEKLTRALFEAVQEGKRLN